jgi:hypothetical protein
MRGANRSGDVLGRAPNVLASPASPPTTTNSTPWLGHVFASCCPGLSPASRWRSRESLAMPPSFPWPAFGRNGRDHAVVTARTLLAEGLQCCTLRSLRSLPQSSSAHDCNRWLCYRQNDFPTRSHPDVLLMRVFSSASVDGQLKRGTVHPASPEHDRGPVGLSSS